jgi:hypothetical protein
MSDAPEPEPTSPAPIAPAGVIPRRGPVRGRPPAPVKVASAEEFPQVRPILIFVGALMVCVHLLLGRNDFEMRDRLLCVVPIFPLLIEIDRFRKLPRGTELPFGVYALLVYYVTFSSAALFNTLFIDLSGPVSFNDFARFQGTAAVAVSSIMLYVGIRLGGRLGTKLQPSLLRVYPPSEMPASYARAVGIYALACMAATQFISLGTQFPAAIGVLIVMSLSLTFVLGAIMAKPEAFRGPWTRYLVTGVIAAGILGGLLRGVLEPLFRMTLTVLTARWVHFRRFSIATIVALLAAYVILQPAKAQFREQTWFVRGSQQQAGYTERVGAWTSAITDVWSGRDTASTTEDRSVGRFLELDPVLHAFTLLPGRVRSAEGEAWVNLLYSPIPRLLWPNKPTSGDLDKSYGVAFNRQSELGARSTSLLMPLIVDGYWNFGWPGIVFVSVAMGLWVGVCQTMYSGDHWALKAGAVSQFSLIAVTGSFALLYAGILQMIVGGIIASWLVYWLARFLATKESVGVRMRLASARPLPRRLPQR